VAQLIALLVLVAMFLPPVRHVLLSLGVFVIGAVVVVGVVAFGVFLIRHTERKSPVDSAHFANLQTTATPQATKREDKLQTTTDLIEQLRSIDWFQFEKLVALVYRKLGYSVTRRGGANPDGGIDLVIEKDGQRLAVQCKQWRCWNVGVKAVREFLGALTDAGISKGVFITLCGYTGDAKQLAEKHGIEIVNEVGLAKMIEQTDARFDQETLAILKDARKFCPKCESEMVMRTAQKGASAGSRFWGCSAYPKCQFTMPA
jgi:restriction system protein